MRCRYTSVLPDPVTPKRSHALKPGSASTASTAALCPALSSGAGAASGARGSATGIAARIPSMRCAWRGVGVFLRADGIVGSAASPQPRA